MSITNRQAICNVLLEAAKTNPDLTVVCSDSRGSGSLTPFAKAYPDQFVEVGIAEQDLVGIAAGLAAGGMQVFAASPASFLTTRSYEQVKVDVAYSSTNVKLIGISGGVSYGALGMTHHSTQDFAAMTVLTGMRVYCPSDHFQTEKLVQELLKDNLPAYIRVSRSATADIYDENMPFVLNQANVIQSGTDALIVAAGEMVPFAKEAAEELESLGFSVGVLDMYCLKPFDTKMLLEMASKVPVVISVEEHSQYGGLGSQIAQALCANDPKPLVEMHLPDTHLVAGTNTEIFKEYGLDARGIARTTLQAIEKSRGQSTIPSAASVQ